MTGNSFTTTRSTASHSLLHTVSRSGLYVSIAKAIRYSFVFFVHLLLMNILRPSDFGLLQAVTIVIGFCMLISELGLPSAVVQQRLITPGALAAGAAGNLLFSLGFYALLFAGAPLFARFWHDDYLTVLIRTAALALPISALSTMNRGMLMRSMRFGTLSLIEAASALCAWGVALGMALNGFGVWALIAGTLLFYSLSSISVLVLSPISWRGWYHGSQAKSMYLFGGGLVAQRIIEFISSNFDKIITGRAFGTATLGIYGVAFDIIFFPTMAIGGVLAAIIFSAFARIADEPDRIRQAFMRLTTLIATLCLPVIVGIGVCAQELMHTAGFLRHDNQWLPAAELLPILTIPGILFVLSSYQPTIWMSQGVTRLRLLWSVGNLVTVAISVLIGCNYGIKGLCYAILIRTVIVFPLFLLFSRHILGISLRTYLRAIAPALICSIPSFLGGYAITRLIPGDSLGRHSAVLLGAAAAMALLYLAALRILFPRTLTQLVATSQGMLTSSGHATTMEPAP